MQRGGWWRSKEVETEEGEGGGAGAGTLGPGLCSCRWAPEGNARPPQDRAPLAGPESPKAAAPAETGASKSAQENNPRPGPPAAHPHLIHYWQG